MKQVKVNGMSCQHCVASVTDALSKVDGVSTVSVDLDSGMASFEAPDSVSMDAVKAAIEQIGFTVES